MDEMDGKGQGKAVIGIIVAVVLVAAVTAVIVFSSRQSSDNQNATTSSDTTQTNQATTSGSGTNNAATSGSYKNGTYSATGRYQTPGGAESIGVNVTIADGTITDASVTQQPISDEAHEYQAAFASGFKSQVVGKKIDEVSLNRVAGSSLTPDGFNNAINTIKTQAQA